MEKLFESKDYVSQRFVCDCMEHYLQINHDKIPGNYETSISFMTLDYNDRSIWEKIKFCFKFLFKKDTCLWDFYLRQRDVEGLIEFLTMIAITLLPPKGTTTTSHTDWEKIDG